jgi:hypothetical protein
MQRLIVTVGLGMLVACQPLTSERSTLARVTVYWRSEGSGEHASSNGVRLREAHCAVDPKKIPYGSKLCFLMQHVWPSTPDRMWLIAKPHAYAGEMRPNATPSSSISFLIPNKRRSPGQKRIHIAWRCRS